MNGLVVFIEEDGRKTIVQPRNIVHIVCMEDNEDGFKTKIGLDGDKWQFVKLKLSMDKVIETLSGQVRL